MSVTNHLPQVESRTETISLSVTATEKRAVTVVAGLRGVPLGEVLRHTSMAEVMAEFEKQLASMAPATEGAA